MSAFMFWFHPVLYQLSQFLNTKCYEYQSLPRFTSVHSAVEEMGLKSEQQRLCFLIYSRIREEI